MFSFARVHTHTYQSPTETAQPAKQAQSSCQPSGNQAWGAGLARHRDVLQTRADDSSVTSRPLVLALPSDGAGATQSRGRDEHLAATHAHHAHPGNLECTELFPDNPRWRQTV